MKSAFGRGTLIGLAAVTSLACSRDARDSTAREPASTGYASEQDRARELRQADRQYDRNRAEREHQLRAIGGGPSDGERRFMPTLRTIAGVFCDRAVRCGDVGPSEKYSSRADCVDKVREEKMREINADECSLGIRLTGLAECTRAIGNQDCGKQLDSIAELRACRSGNVCLK